MPEQRLERARETLPVDGSYQFGFGAFGVIRCHNCGEYGHSYCGIVGFFTASEKAFITGRDCGDES